MIDFKDMHPIAVLRHAWWLWAPFLVAVVVLNLTWLAVMGCRDATPWPLIDIAIGCALATLAMSIPVLAMFLFIRKLFSKRWTLNWKWYLPPVTLAALFLSYGISLVEFAGTAMRLARDCDQRAPQAFNQIAALAERMDSLGVQASAKTSGGPPVETSIQTGVANWLLASARDLGSAPAARHIKELALQSSNKAIERHPKDWMALESRAIANQMLGRDQEALADYNAAIGTAPQEIELYVFRAGVLNVLGKYQSAIDDCAVFDGKRQISRFAALWCYQSRADAYYGLGRYEEAVNNYSRAIRVNPKHPKAYYGRSLAYEKLGRHDLAEVDRQKAQELGYQPD